MSTNCLVTKLKGVVDNDNLKKFGVFQFVLKGDGTGLQYQCKAGAKVNCSKAFSIQDGGTVIATNVNSFVAPRDGTYALINLYNGDCDFEYDKYKSINFVTFDAGGANAKSVSSLDIADLKFLQPSLSSGFLSISTRDSNDNELYGSLKIQDIEYINVLKLIRLINSPTATEPFIVDINELDAPELETLDVRYTSAVCNVETINTPKLTTLNVTGCINYTGDLKVWAANMWNNGNGRTSGKCRVSYIDASAIPAKVTWDGQSLYAASGVYSPYIHFHENEAPTLETT